MEAEFEVQTLILLVRVSLFSPFLAMWNSVSDELLGTFVPILLYWAYSGIYTLLGSFENYRLHSKKDEDVKNLVSKGSVVKGVLLQQMVQAAVAILLFTVSLVETRANSFSLYGFV